MTEPPPSPAMLPPPPRGCAEEPVYAFRKVNAALWGIPELACAAAAPAAAPAEPARAVDVVSADAAAAAAAAERARFERDWAAEVQRLRPGAEEGGGLVSRCFFSWLNPFIALALREELDENAFPTPLRAHRARMCGSRLSAAFRDGELRCGLHAWCAYVERTALVNGAVVCEANALSCVRCCCGDAACACARAVGRLRWVGCLRACDAPERVYAGVEWDDALCVPAYRSGCAGCAGVHDGAVHGERLFYQVRAAAPCCTLEPVECVALLGADAALRAADMRAGADADAALPAAPRAAASCPVPRSPSLFWTLLRTFKSEVSAVFVYAFLTANTSTFTPVFLEKSIGFIQSSDSGTAHSVGGVFILLAFAGLKLVQPLVENKFEQLGNRVSSMFRSGILSLLFEKCLTIDPQALADPEISPGRILTMASSDVETLRQLPRFIGFLAVAPYEILFYFVYLSFLVGWSMLSAVLVFMLALPAQAYLTKLQASIMERLNACTDQRLRATSELFSGIRVVKTMGWEPRFLQVIQEARQAELRQRHLLQATQVILSLVMDALPWLMVMVVLTVYTTTGHELTPTVAFPLVAIFGSLTWPLMLLPMTLSYIAKSYVSAQRLQRFLQCDDHHLAVKILASSATCDSPAGTAPPPASAAAAPWCDDAIVFSHATMTARVKCALPPCASVLRQRGGVWRALARVRLLLPCVARARVPVELEWEPCGGDAHAVAVAGADGADGAGSADAAEPAPAAEELYAMEPRAVLHDVSVRIPRGALTVVVGATGSGKSSLLTSVLGAFALAADGGEVWASANIAYVPQQPWIMQATIRENIVFYDDRASTAGGAAGDAADGDSDALADVPMWGSPLRHLRRRRRHGAGPTASGAGAGTAAGDERMLRAVRCCQLETDLQELRGGLGTEIGERGINLSGGQKARVSLARAVYADRDVYLLDDPLSALDAHVGKRVLQDVVLGALRGKTCVLATHHLDALPSAACVVVMDGGRCVFSGSYAEYAASEWRAYLERKEAAAAAAEDDGGAPAADLPVHGNEFSPVARERAGGFDNAAADDAHDIADGAAVAADGANDRYAEDAYSSCASSCDGADAATAKSSTHAASAVPDGAIGPDAGGDAGDAAARLIEDEEKESGHIPWAVYKRFIEFAGGTATAVMLVLVFFSVETIMNISTIWISLWSTRYFTHLSTNEYLCVYVGIVLSAVVFDVLRALYFYHVMLRAMRELHQRMLFSVASARVSFFDTTPIGRILNRFTKDVYTMDEEVVREGLFFLSVVGYPVESLIIAGFSTPPAIVAIVIVLFVFAKLLVFYARVLREVRRRGNVASSPMFSLLEEVGGGRETIAAYDKAHVLFGEAMQRVDKLYATSYMERVLNSWMAIRVEYCAAVVLISVLTVAVLQRIFYPDTLTSGRVALYSLSITMTLDFNWSFPAVVTESAMLEACFSSVQRMEHYVDDIDHEKLDLVPMAGAGGAGGATGAATDVTVCSSNSCAPPAGASRGSLEFRHVDMRYRAGLPLVLRDVSFLIGPREKIGVVGRTGSGKSTLLQTFMRLVDTCGGSMLVNGRDAREYELRDLRRVFSMIPQDPLLFEGSVRSNVDPFGESSDAEILRALSLVGLGGSDGAGAPASPGSGAVVALGVDAAVTEGGKNFSVGQRQLLCLARALLKKGSDFILMDEATANIDPVLDRKVQDVVRTSFAAYTVVTIAHRLHTVASYDRVFVMQHGELVEQGRPRDLVLDRDSLFYRMVAQGAAVARVRGDGADGAADAHEDGAGGDGGADAGVSAEGAEGAAAHELRVAQVVAEFLRECQA